MHFMVNTDDDYSSKGRWSRGLIKKTAEKVSLLHRRLCVELHLRDERTNGRTDKEKPTLRHRLSNRSLARTSRNVLFDVTRRPL